MRFHVVSLPHTQVTRDFEACAYTTKTRRFCTMMRARGHDVFLYAGTECEADVTKLFTVVEPDEQQDWFGDQRTERFFSPSWDVNHPSWRTMNARTVAEIDAHAEPHDFVCLIGGVCQQPIAAGLPRLQSVEYGVGYKGVMSPPAVTGRVFESYAWMHFVYGLLEGTTGVDGCGRFFDAVIPNYYDLDDFPLSTERGDHYLFIGRLIDRKGWHLAKQVCDHLGVELRVAGQHDDGLDLSGVTYLGVLDAEQRAREMGAARAVFAPTLYVGPFEGVNVEAQLCGTPVITTDWGAFTETVNDGVTGFRCRTFAEFVAAAEQAHTLDPYTIRGWAASRYSTEVVAKQYEDYFDRCLTLWGDGFYTV